MKLAIVIILCLACGCVHDGTYSTAAISGSDEIERVERDLEALLLQIGKYEEHIREERPKGNKPNEATYWRRSVIEREMVNPSSRYLKDLIRMIDILDARLESLKAQSAEVRKWRVVNGPGQE